MILKSNDKKAVPWELLLLADPSRKRVKEYWERGISYFYEDDGELAGLYVLIKTRPFTFELVNIAVKDFAANKGIGKKLLIHAIEKAKSLDGKVLQLGTGNSSIRQLAIYQKAGFRIVGVEKDHYSNFYEDEIVEDGIVCRDMIRLEMILD